MTKIIDLKANKEYEIPSCELIWAGLGDITVNIIGGTKRELDAFYFVHGESVIRFQHRPLTTTNQKYWLPVLSPGKYEIEYSIISVNFCESLQRYILDFDGTVTGVKFGEKP